MGDVLTILPTLITRSISPSFSRNIPAVVCHAPIQSYGNETSPGTGTVVAYKYNWWYPGLELNASPLVITTPGILPFSLSFVHCSHRAKCNAKCVVNNGYMNRSFALITVTVDWASDKAGYLVDTVCLHF